MSPAATSAERATEAATSAGRATTPAASGGWAGSDEGLVLDGVTRRYAVGGAAALDGLTVPVPGGACLVLLGPSGSGKSTALRLVAGLEPLDAGRVLLDGADLAGVPPERRRMAMLAQRPLLFGHLSVLDNVAFPHTVRGVPRRRAHADARARLDAVGLPGFERRRPGELSGGQQQRVALARALAAGPRVLLLDEPTTGLDTGARAEVHELLRRVRADLTLLLVTHDPVEAATLADRPGDRVAVLRDGLLQQHAPVGELYARPASLTVARLLGGRTEVPGTVRAGRHVSPLGALQLPVPVPAGPGVLVVRPELVELVPAGSGIAGTVAEVRVLGARALVTVAVAGAGGTARVHAEAPLGRQPAVGDPVGLRVPVDVRTVVPPSEDGERQQLP